MLSRFGNHSNKLPNTGIESNNPASRLAVAHNASKQPIPFPFALPATAPKRLSTPLVRKETIQLLPDGEPGLFFRSNAANAFWLVGKECNLLLIRYCVVH
jgi:hypothetical protein